MLIPGDGSLNLKGYMTRCRLISCCKDACAYFPSLEAPQLVQSMLKNFHAGDDSTVCIQTHLCIWPVAFVQQGSGPDDYVVHPCLYMHIYMSKI